MCCLVFEKLLSSMSLFCFVLFIHTDLNDQNVIHMCHKLERATQEEHNGTNFNYVRI